VVRQLWTREETGLLTRGLQDTLREARGGTDFDGKQRETVHNFWDVDSPHRATEGSTGVAAAAFVEDDPRLLSKVEQILGPGFEGSFNGRSNNDGNVYVGSTMWHADMGWDPKIPTGRLDPLRKAAAEGTANDNANLHMFPSIKVAFYLEPVTAESGALRVVPASHRSPLHEACWSLHSGIPARVSDEGSARQAAELTRMAGDATSVLTDPSANAFGVRPEEVPHQCVESSPGDAIFFSHQLWHAAFGGGVRHMFCLNYRAALPSDREEQLRTDWDDVARGAGQAPGSGGGG